DGYTDLHRRVQRPFLAPALDEHGRVPRCVFGGGVGGFPAGRQRELLGRRQRRPVGGRLSPRRRHEHLGQVGRPQPQDQDHGHESRDDDRDRPLLAVHGNSWRIAVEASRRTSEGKNTPANGTAMLAPKSTVTTTGWPTPPARTTVTSTRAGSRPGAASSAATRTAPSSGSTAACREPARGA